MPQGMPDGARCYTPALASLYESVAFHPVKVSPPDTLVLIPPAAHQVGADKNIGTAGIAGNIVASTQIEQPGLVAVAAPDISKEIT